MENNQTSSFVEKLRQIVLDNFNNEQFGVKDLSNLYGLSRSQLHKKLKKQTGKSVSQFIREIRLDEAKILLEQDDVTVSEVAYQVGFSSATYFNTRFKDYFGYPPGEVRMRLSYEKEDRENIFNDAGKHQGFRKTYRKKWLVGGVVLSMFIIMGFIFFKNFNTPRNTLETDNQSFDIADSISTEKTIAVLPLKNWSGNPDLEYASNGMTDAIINKLSQIQNIDKVIPFTTTLAYKETDFTMPELAEKLGVNYILEGSFQHFGQDFRINVRLVDALRNKSDWSESFNGPWQINEIFAIQSNIAESVADRLKAEILEEEYESLHRAPTLNQEAYNYFLRAEYNMLKLDNEAIEKSKLLYEKAIALDPNFVNAHIRLGLAWCLSGLVWGIHNEQYAWSKAKEHISKARQLDGIEGYDRTNVDIHYDAASYFFEWNFDAGKKHYDSFFLGNIDPNTSKLGHTQLNLAVDFAKHHGRFEDALLLLEEITNRGKGVLAGIKVTESLMRTFLGQREMALEQLKIDDELFDDNMYYLMESAQIYYYLDERENFDKNLTKLMRQFKDRSPRILFLNAVNENLKGNLKKEKDFVKALVQKYDEKAAGSPAWFTALYYAHLNNQQACLEWLSKSYERREVEMVWFRSEPLLQFINCAPQYLKLYEMAGFLVEPPCKPESDTLRKIEISDEKL